MKHRLRRKSDLSRVPERKVTIAFTPTGGKQVEVWQLAPLSGLTQLRQDGFIGISSGPLSAEDDAASNDVAMAATPRYSVPPQATNTQQPWPPPQSSTSAASPPGGRGSSGRA